jgi:hypothetical protein
LGLWLMMMLPCGVGPQPAQVDSGNPLELPAPAKRVADLLEGVPREVLARAALRWGLGDGDRPLWEDTSK